jgi:FKBP-type peptidyl-prolyl cis-trans isomerase
MMKYTIILLLASLSFITCNKKSDTACTPASAASESSEIAAFCNANGINYVVDPNGIYYQIIDPGSGVTPNANSTITVTYTASTLDGNIVEDNTTSSVTLPLSQFIEGWLIAIPYIQKGGHIKMVIPSSLAYGCTGTNKVAPNSPLYYDIVLLNVQ